MPPDQDLETAAHAGESESLLPPALRRAYTVSRRAAVHVLRRRFRLLRLLKKAYLKLGIHDDAMGRVREDFGTMMRMTKAWALREYRTVPWKSLVYMVGAIIYFVNPIDVIPDVLGAIGFIDDAAVAAAVIRAVQAQLDAFREWEKHSGMEEPSDEIDETTPIAA